MQYSLMQEIFNFMIENRNEFQLLNATTTKFRAYIFDEEGEYLKHGGKQVSSYILRTNDLINKYSQHLTDEQL